MQIELISIVRSSSSYSTLSTNLPSDTKSNSLLLMHIRCGLGGLHRWSVRRLGMAPFHGGRRSGCRILAIRATHAIMPRAALATGTGGRHNSHHQDRGHQEPDKDAETVDFTARTVIVIKAVVVVVKNAIAFVVQWTTL